MKQRALALLGAAAAALAVTAVASGHAKVDPPVAVTGQTQLFSIMVPSEKDSPTTKVELTPPAGFKVWGPVEQTGWTTSVEKQGSGEDATVTKITWSGGSIPGEHTGVLQFTGYPEKGGDYALKIRQTYGDGSVVDWSGSESSDTPAAIVKGESSLGGGGGTSVLDVITLVAALLALALAAAALVTGRGGRPIA